MKEITEQEYETLQSLFQRTYCILESIHGIKADSMWVGSDGIDVYYHNEDIEETSMEGFSKKDIVGDLKVIKNNKLKNDPEYKKYLELKRKFEK